jgi:trimeric autotransporter adhesin
MAYIGVSPSNGTRRVHTYTATASQTTFSGAGAEGATLSYKDSNFVDVYQNGVKLGDADYTATSGTSIVLGTGASVSDLVVIVVYDVFSVADTVSKADGGTFDGNVTMAGTLATTGNATFSGDIIKSTSGTSNFAAGVNAGNSIASGGNYNTVIGDEAGTALTTGDGNVAVGFEALKTEDANGFNTGVGYQALKTLNAGADSYNTAFGYQAGTAITTGIQNTLLGGLAGDVLTDADYNIAIGLSALGGDTKGNKSVAIGANALAVQNFTSPTDSNNTAVGYKAGNAVTTGIQNTIIGSLAGDALVDADYNVAVGKGALSSCTYGSKSTAIGTACLEAQNISSAADSLNTAVGFSAGYGLTSGTQNTLMGVNSGVGAITGTGNSCYGLESGNSITSGAFNTLIGRYTADSLTTGDYNTHLGNDTDVSANNVQFTVAIGHGAVDKGTNTGMINPTSGVYQGNNSSSWSTTSDIRIKKNITDNNIGLDAINQVQVKNFEYRTEDEIVDFDNPKAAVVQKEGVQLGVIAQEIQSILPDVVTEQSTGVLAVNPDNITWYLVNAVKELSAEIKKLKGE